MVLAVAIFMAAYIVIASEKLPRHWVALAGGALLVASTPVLLKGVIGWH